MPTSMLTAWFYDSAMGAASGDVRLRDLRQRGEALSAVSAIATWVPGAKEPRVGHHLRHWPGSPRDSFLAALLSSCLPAGPDRVVKGTTTAATTRRLRGTGISSVFLERLTENITPGRSVLLVAASDSDIPAVRSVVERGRVRGDVPRVQVRLGLGAVDVLAAMAEENADQRNR